MKKAFLSTFIKKIKTKTIKVISPYSLKFEVQLVEHCNLNCAYCSHFSPLAKIEFLDTEDYRKDITRLSKLFNGNASNINLMGGEPLLHPQIEEFLYITRNAFPSATIQLVSNGLLLPKMTESFWNTCKQFDIVVAVTQYPVNVDYDLCEKLALKHNVKYHIFRYCKEDGMRKHTLNKDGALNYKHQFKNCDVAGVNLLLQKGRIYPCSVAATIHHFNEFFNYNLQTSDLDSIDIYKANSKKEIIKFIKHPIPFCRYCDIEHYENNQKWHVSKRDINEWIG